MEYSPAFPHGLLARFLFETSRAAGCTDGGLHVQYCISSTVTDFTSHRAAERRRGLWCTLILVPEEIQLDIPQISFVFQNGETL